MKRRDRILAGVGLSITILLVLVTYVAPPQAGDRIAELWGATIVVFGCFAAWQGFRALRRPPNEPATRGAGGTGRCGPFFWMLAPFLTLLMAVVLLVDKKTTVAVILFVGLESFALLMLLGLFDPTRFQWAWRGVGGLLFLGCAAYLISELLEGGNAVRFPKNRAESNAFNALMAMIVFGLPGLRFAILGRLQWRPVDESDQALHDGPEPPDED